MTDAYWFEALPKPIVLDGRGGGGQPFMATAGGKDISKIDDAISFAKAEIEKVL